jgi:hypothetical protein
MQITIKKPTSAEMRATYKKVFGKEFDSPERKAAPLPLSLAYQVAVFSIKNKVRS